MTIIQKYLPSPIMEIHFGFELMNSKLQQVLIVGFLPPKTNSQQALVLLKK